MRRLFFLTSLLLMAGALALHAQQEPSFSHYFYQEAAFNPAAAGKEDKLNVVGSYAYDFAGFEHNPRTMLIAADMPFQALKLRQGAGAQFMNDKLGLFSHKRFALQYALQTRLFGGRMAIGAQLTMLSESFNGSKVDAEQASDPAIPTTDVTGSKLDFSLGLYYMHGAWYAGLSAAHIASPTVDLGETYELPISSTYYFTGGYNIKLRNPFLTIAPSVLIRTDMTSWRADLTARMIYRHEKKVFYGGVGYSPTNSVSVYVGGSFHGVMLGYSYEIYTSSVNPGNGSHGLFVGYQHDINLAKKGRNKHKSVRIL